jgi:hypothetical protein
LAGRLPACLPFSPFPFMMINIGGKSKHVLIAVKSAGLGWRKDREDHDDSSSA